MDFRPLGNGLFITAGADRGTVLVMRSVQAAVWRMASAVSMVLPPSQQCDEGHLVEHLAGLGGVAHRPQMDGAALHPLTLSTEP